MSFWNNFFGANGDPDAQFGAQENQFANEYNPWIQNGENANNFLQGQYKNLANNPDALQNQMMQGYYSSPFQSNLLNQTTNRMNMNAANTGMLGSPAANLQLGQQLNDMTGQFQNDYVNRGMGSYGMGINGLQNTASMGMNALNQRTGLEEQGAIANMAAQKTNNSLWPNAIGQLTGLGMGIGSMFMGAPSAAGAGAAAVGGAAPSIGAGAYGASGGYPGWAGTPMMAPQGGFNPAMFGGGDGSSFNPWGGM